MQDAPTDRSYPMVRPSGYIHATLAHDLDEEAERVAGEGMERYRLWMAGTPNGGEHCAPPGGTTNTCYRHPDGRCDSCGHPGG